MPCAASYQRQYQPAYRSRNRERLAVKSLKARHESRDRAFLELGNECMDCGETDPRTFEFDHMRGEKVCNVSRLFGKAWHRLKAELVKCDLVCANCHAIRGYHRREGARCEL